MTFPIVSTNEFWSYVIIKLLKSQENFIESINVQFLLLKTDTCNLTYLCKLLTNFLLSPRIKLTSFSKIRSGIVVFQNVMKPETFGHLIKTRERERERERCSVLRPIGNNGERERERWVGGESQVVFGFITILWI